MCVVLFMDKLTKSSALCMFVHSFISANREFVDNLVPTIMFVIVFIT